MATKRLMCLISIFGLVVSTASMAKMPKALHKSMDPQEKNIAKVGNLSILQIRVKPTRFRVGDTVHVLVKVGNRGNVIENNISVNLTISGQQADMVKDIATITPGEIVEADFTCIIGRRKSELIEIAAIIEPIEVKKRPKGKIKKVRYNYLYDTEGDVGILYKVEPPVHQWIAFQAYNKLPTGTLKSEMNSYLPTSSSSSYYSSSFSPPSGWENDDNSPYVSSEALIEGAWEEDTFGVWMNHFWDPDSGYDVGLPLYDSTLERAQEDLWQQAISAYGAGNKALAYYRVGRIVHLLMDMSVPAHTLLDIHWPDDDQYEEFTNDNYKNITSSSPNTGIPSSLPSYPQYTPPSYNDNLTKLFYNLAEKSDDFDSDDEDGESTDYGKGKYTLGRNALDASKTFSRAEYFVWTLLSGWEKERDLVRYVDYDIFRSCINSNEYHIYYYRSFYDEYNNTLTYWVKVYYTDGSYEFVDRDLEELGDVPDSVLECIHQPELQARAVGYVAALYQLFWDSVDHPDTDPPSPSPLTWSTEPYQTSTSSISMTATVASDESPPIYYEFDFFTSPTGGSGGTDSGWQTSTSYTDPGLEVNHRYSYRIRAKDSALAENTTAWSLFSDEYTDIETPSGITFGTITTTSIQAKSNNTPSGLDRGSSGLYISASTGQYSGWKQNNDYWTCTGLTPNYDTGFRIKARNGDGDETGYCTTAYKYTLANQPGPLPFSNITTNSIQVNWTSNGNYYYTDYYCENLTTGQNSGWTTETSWDCGSLYPNTEYDFRTKARNGDGVETDYYSTQYQYTLANIPGVGYFSNRTPNSIQVNWTANGNPPGTQYYCENISDGTNSGWTTEISWISTELNSETLYSFHVKARNVDSAETEWINLGCIYGGGLGTPSDPYLIYTPEQMNAIGAHPVDWDKCFKLMADVDLGGYTGEEFNIIGERYYDAGWVEHPFTGIFDGNDHTISNFTYGSNDKNFIGLFGFVNDPNAEIKNLGMITPNVDAVRGWGVGPLVGFLWDGTITDCYAEGSGVSGDFGLGGLIGENAEGTITNCYSTSSVSGHSFLGGLVGRNEEGTITNCYSGGSVKGSVTGGSSCVGGLVGCNYYLATINNCYSISSVSGENNVGTLVGHNHATITNCYSSGSVLGVKDVGGLVGDDLGGTITNCYSSAAVSGTTNVGGLVGSDSSGVYTSSFWDNIINPSLTGIGNATNPNVIGESTANMQTESTFTDAGWDFLDIWDICEGTNYPKLVWSIPAADFVCPDGVTMIDFAFFAGYWLDDNCGYSNDCDGADLDFSNSVDSVDLKIFCGHWLEGSSP